MRSAFGFGGQKSANSRNLSSGLSDVLSGCSSRRRKIAIGDPSSVELDGPDHRPARCRPSEPPSPGRRDETVRRRHLTDGDLTRGFYVEPTVVGGLPTRIGCSDELFAPFTAVAAVIAR
jgi:hypothetical protein